MSKSQKISKKVSKSNLKSKVATKKSDKKDAGNIVVKKVTIKKPVKKVAKVVEVKEVDEVKRPVGRPRKSEEDPTITTFKKTYDSDPEFKRKHLDYVTTKVMCECGFQTCRNNLIKHRKSHLHINRLKALKEQENKTLTIEIVKLNKSLEVHNKLLEQLIKKNIK